MMKRVEHHRLKPSSPFYAMLREFCHRSKNLYNHGNFLIRQAFLKDGKWLRYGEVDRLLKADADYPDYVGTGHRQEQGLETGSKPRPQAQPELCAAAFRPLHPDAPVQGRVNRHEGCAD